MPIAAEPTAQSRRPSAPSGLTRVFLACGLIAGPLYLVVGITQALTRPGFDILRDDLSLLANGDLGWIQVTNLVLTGTLTIAGTVGMRRALSAGRGRTWGPLLLGVYGAGLIGAGFFTADPAYGFPPGTPADAHAVSWHGMLHIVTAGIGFLALISACFVLASRFADLRERGWATYSRLTGVVFFAAFVGVATGSGQSWSVIGFWIGVICAWAWVSIVAVRLLAEHVSAQAEDGQSLVADERQA